MMISQMLRQLEKDIPVLPSVWGRIYIDDFQGKLALLFRILGISKNTCMEICGYGDMKCSVYGIQVTYDKSPDASAKVYMDAYEETVFAEKMYQYIISNFDNDYILFKLL